MNPPSSEDVKVAISVAAFLLSLASFFVAMRSAARARKAEAIKNLLGSKETVAFAALKVLSDGLPSNEKDRKQVVMSLVQACVFSSSDRARALLYQVVDTNRKQYQNEFDEAAAKVRSSFEGMTKYKFDDEDLDLARGNRRLAALRRVIEALPSVPATK